jgi:predicted Zn finger-like uncharacterized protein
MPEIVSCPECGRKLKVPDDFLGKKVKCPQCSKTFTAEAESGGGGGGGKEKEKEKDRDRDRDDDRRSSSRDRDRDDDRRSSRDRDRDDDRTSERRSGRDDDDDRGRGRGRDRDRDDDDDRDRGRSRRDRDDDDDDRGRGRGRDRDDDDDDRDRGRGRGGAPRGEKAGWQSVTTGLLFIIISVIIYLSIIPVYFLGIGLTWAAKSLTIAQGVAWLILLMGIASMLVNLTGHVFNIGVTARPPYSTKGLALSTLITTAVSYICYGLIMVMMLSLVLAAFAGAGFGAGMGMGPAAADSMAVLVLGLFCTGTCTIIAAFFLCCFFLRSVCVRVKREDLGRSVVAYMIAQTVAVVGYILLSFLVGLIMASMMGSAVRRGGMDPETGMGMVYCMMVYYAIWFLVFVGLLIWYLIVLTQVKGAVQYYVRKKL